ncbi:Digestive cysteine proteinase 2 [Eumeta japonica]|uniref:Digestive cysteine proteinase 2 n=1 Tax=Eumeta variegata TaxID=151549 RepID=A0A4C1ZQU9_EUMVA|nr:Digestive cysteine proteinase 2 [Eumeta japonica]
MDIVLPIQIDESIPYRVSIVVMLNTEARAKTKHAKLRKTLLQHKLHKWRPECNCDGCANSSAIYRCRIYLHIRAAYITIKGAWLYTSHNSRRGSNVPSRGDGSDRGDGHGRPITIGSDRYRDSYSRDNYNRPGGGARSGNVFGPRREGIAKGHASLQPGEDCDEDESVDSIEEYSPSITQRVESSNQYRGSASRPDRPKSSKVYKPSGARSAIPYPSMFLEPPFNPASPSSTANAAIGTSIYLPPLDAKGSEVVEVLLKNWQEEIREKRDNVMREVAPSKNEYDSYSYSDYDEGPSEVVPETPLWRGSYKLRGALSAPLAGYTETYTMWYNGDTGESRLDFNGGTALSLRLRLPNGSYRLLSTERMELPEGTKRMCRVGTGMISSPKEMGPPALPDMKAFKFAGWLSGAERSKVGASSSDGRVERWQREVRVKEHAPENQTSEEENLTYRHEMVVVRRSHGAVPLRYSVYVDSSHLGVASDAYMHTYREFEHLTSPQEHLNYNLETGCDVQEQANISDLEHRAALEPLREFTEESRSPLYSIMLARYKIRFVRRYYNFKEDVLRRNILMQKARFVGCVNRRGETFRLEINFLADRLKAEVAQLFGALPFPHGAVTTASVPFPYDRSTLRRRARTLPRAFDWREKGAIGPVEFQGTCMSCWAFAVTAAIEGGLFAHTGHKRTLSKQCLVDCGHDTNANGCAPTWPKYAYEYVRRHGLPTNSSYPYTGQKKECTSAGLSPIVSIRGYVDVTNHSVNALKVSIYENGPVVVIIDAKSQYFQLYSSGVLDDPECGKLTRDTNHAVLAVGWGEENGKTYFILKNSWSQSWGDGGYVKFNGFTNTCGVLTQPSYPLEPRLEGKAVAGSSAENDYVR